MLGMAVTVGALINGLRYFSKSDGINQQKMMRLRVGAQAFAVISLLTGVGIRNYMNSDKK